MSGAGRNAASLYFARGCQLADETRYAEALEAFDLALAAEESCEARWNRAQTLLALGRYPEGFSDNEIRFRVYPGMLPFVGYRIRNEVSSWHGEDLTGKSIVLIHEQGLGDVVLLLRYVDVLKSMGARVTLEVPAELRRFALRLGSVYLGRDADYCCLMYDLPWHCGTTPATVPPSALTPDPELVEKWRDRFSGTRTKIGIAWQSRADRDRSMSLETMLRWLGSGCDVVALQTNDLAAAQRHGVIVPGIVDIADVAAIIALMDRVIAVDTLVLNVAGAVNHPNVFGLLPYRGNWKWLNGSPWYPQVQIRRQAKPKDWESAWRGNRSCFPEAT
jgi:hypothetical protein